MNILRWLLVVLVLLSVVRCTSPTDPTPPPTIDKLLIGSATDVGYTAEVYANVAIAEGYNPLFVRVLHNGVALSDAHVTVIPDMDMGTMHHSCPVVQPKDSIPDSTGLYNCAVFFTMPSATDWKVGVAIHDHRTDTTVTVHVPVSVSANGNVRIVQGTASTKFIFTLLSDSWKVGMNDVKFNVYLTTDGFDHTPVDDASLKMVPTMPSMGHGSMGNVHPTSTGGGWYTGRANFTMTGDWQLDLTASTIDAPTLNAKYQIVVH